MVGALAAGGPAGCGLPRVVADEPSHFYDVFAFGYAIGGEGLPVETHGHPDGIDPARFNADVRNALTGKAVGPPLPPEAQRPYRVVLVFSPQEPTPPIALCANRSFATGTTRETTLIIRGAYCRGGGVLTTATAYVPAPPDIPRAVSELVTELFPWPRRDDDDRCRGVHLRAC